MALRRFNIGIIGCGSLGRSAAALLERKRETFAAEGLALELTCVLGRRGGIRDAGGLDCAALASKAARLEDVPGYEEGFGLRQMLEEHTVDVALEFTPTNRETGEPGLTHIRECLRAGVHVATGNKGPILLAWEELSALARERGLLLGVSCTTGGALPTLLNGCDAMSGSTVLSLEGVLNGTTNFILERMERGGAYEAALREAQEAGVAEANPAQDVEGWDTAVKLLIMARVVMGANLGLRDISVTGIIGVTEEDVRRAREEGRRIKLVGRAWREGASVRASVAPRAVEADDPFHGVCGKNKAVRFVSDTMGELFISGCASDPEAAAAAALRDVVNAWRGGLLK